MKVCVCGLISMECSASATGASILSHVRMGADVGGVVPSVETLQSAAAAANASCCCCSSLFVSSCCCSSCSVWVCVGVVVCGCGCVV